MEIEKDKSHGTVRRHREFRLFLQDELAKRCSHNPNYSLRSFAKFLGVSPAALSDLLNSKRPVTVKMKERLGFKLGLSLSELSQLKAKPHGNSKSKTSFNTEVAFQPIAIDLFSVISEPYHYALLELLKTEDFEQETKWIARRLKITVSQVNIAIERLERVGLLARDTKGYLIDKTNGFRSDIREGLSSEAQRRSLICSHELAIAAIRTIPVEFRDNTSMTMAVNTSDLPRAKQMIKEFRRQFCFDLESNTNLDEVYQINISFVPLTELKSKFLTRGKK